MSSSEAEYVAMLEAVKEIRFIYLLLKGMGVDFKLPIVVRCDNVGAIFMAENLSSGIRTRHINTRYHFVREYIKYGLIKIVLLNQVSMMLICLRKMWERKHMKSMSTSF
jgi:hypothetical protein